VRWEPLVVHVEFCAAAGAPATITAAASANSAPHRRND
jgi:hypothetical protein